MCFLENEINKLVSIIGDYERFPTSISLEKHIEKWINQFDEPDRLKIMQEVCHLLEKTYFSKANFISWIGSELLSSDIVTGGTHSLFWGKTCFLNLQGETKSQTRMLQVFNESLEAETGISVWQEPEVIDQYFYLDDGLFTGGTIKKDLEKWLSKENFPKGKDVALYIVVLVSHTSGYWFLSEKIIKELGTKFEINIELKFYYIKQFFNGVSSKDESDVFWLKSFPNDKISQEYKSVLDMEIKKNNKKEYSLREGDCVGKNNYFSSPESRNFLEHVFFKKSAEIRKNSGNFTTAQRPMGYKTTWDPGFGATCITFRNCPNNCPLVFWADDVWYPLFPRQMAK